MKAYPTTAETVLRVCEQFGGLFAMQVERITKLPRNAINDALRALSAGSAPKLHREKRDVPKELRRGTHHPEAWFYTVTRRGKAKAPVTRGEYCDAGKKVPPRTPTEWQPMRGSGLYGNPIVLRPGSDYALRSEPYISMEARR